MLGQQRQGWILRQLQESGGVTVAQIVAQMGVSSETARRDLLQMEKQGQLRRVHGGAVSIGEMKPFQSLELRNQDQREAKRELSAKAAALIRPGDIVGIDSGSTATFVAEALRDLDFPFTVVTHSSAAFDILKDQENITLIICAGLYNRKEQAFYGDLACSVLSRLHMNRFFLFPSAVSLAGGIGLYDQELSLVMQQYLSHSDQVYVLADSSKFEKTALLKLAEMSQDYVYITDNGLPEYLRELYRENNLQVL